MMRGWYRSGLLTVFLAAGAAMGRAQAIPAEQPGVTPPSTSRVPGGIDPTAGGRNSGLPAAMQEKMAIQRNDERQKRLVADTEQLLALATKLKEEVDKTDKYTLSLDVVKRTTEIEKLAKSIRERMKD